MRPVDLTPILPQSNLSAAGGGGGLLSQLLTSGRPVSLEVLKVLSSTSVLFQSHKGSLTLEASNTDVFKPGSQWLLKAEAKTGQPVLLSDGTSSARRTNIDQPVVVTVRSGGQADKTVASAPRQVGRGLATSSPAVSSEKNTGEQAPVSRERSVSQLEPVIAEHRRAASLKQNSLSGVFSSVRALAKASASSLKDVPNGDVLQKLAVKIEAMRVPQSSTADAVRLAVRHSGVFHEAGTVVGAGGKPGSEVAQLPKGQLLQFQGNSEGVDLKGALQSMVRVVHQSGRAPLFHLSTSNAPPPPDKGEPVQAQRPASPVLLDVAGDGFIAKLLDQAVEGLSRLKLLQIASLPAGDGESASLGDKGRVQIQMDIPLAVSQEQTAIVGLRINGDGGGQAGSEQAGMGWSVELSVDTEETGPVDAFVRFGGGGVRIDVWAGQKEFAEKLMSKEELLRAYLAEEGFEVGAVDIMHGRRPDPGRYLKHGAGYYLDNSL